MKVYLIGAGPGDPGLLTLKAKEVLETADVVAYDYLANERFISYAKPGAEIIYVGKKGGDHTLPQEGINALLVEKAKQGKVVARLKGGDPYMFGRGAEEAQELLEAGVEFEVIPGVTSAVAAPAYAGIPLTHRDFASSVTLITGHESQDKVDAGESVHDWSALARSGSTLVFFMGVGNLPNIAKNLMGAGMDGTKPVALVRWGTTCRHRSMTATLATVADEAKRLGFKSPSIIVVGDVVQLRDTLNTFERKPLLGKGVVVTRAREQASSLVAKLQDLGACVYQFPTIEITELADYAEVDAEIDRLADYDWLIFTSVNGVKHFWNRLAEKGLDTRAIGSAQVAAIGPATAEALRLKGVNPDFVPQKYVAEGVVQGLLELGVKGKQVLVPRALKAREVLPEELAKAGAKVKILPVYEAVPANSGKDKVLQAMEQGEIDYVTFASSSTVDNFLDLIPVAELKKHQPGVKLAAIGPITAKTMQGHGLKPDVQPEDYTIPALVDELVRDAGK